MADRISREHRSWNMSRIKSRDTKPEIVVRSMLHRMGFRFRLHRKDLPGCPDIVLPKYYAAIFVHGCFWHRHKNCRLAYTPKTRSEFWLDKFEQNKARDRVVQLELKAIGWTTLTIWECETKNSDKIAEKLARFFASL